ncbi:unnamed protein product, partial [Symbiodinium necroappetens]
MYMCRARLMQVAPSLWSTWHRTPVIAGWFRALGVLQFCRRALQMFRPAVDRPRLNLAQRISRGLARPRGWQVWANMPPAGFVDHNADEVLPLVSDDDDEPGARPLTICVLTPEFEPEVVPTRLPAGATQDDVLWALRRRRMDFRGRVFPMVVLPHCQAARGWLITLAIPSWAIVDTFAYFDLRAVDGRLFADSVPSTIDRQRILRFAGLDEAGDWDVFVGDSLHPLVDLQEIAVSTGTLFAISSRDGRRDQVSTVYEVLAETAHWEERPAIPVGQGRNVCAVLDQGHRRLRRIGDQGALAEIFESLSLRADSARICHAHPLTRDVTMKGFACQEVLAVISPGDAGVANAPMGPACIFDCRGLLQGWLLWPFTGIGPCCADVRDLLEMFMPPSWELYIEGASRVQDGCWPAVDGQIFWASFIPAEIASEPGAGMHEEDDQPDDSSDGEADASPDPAPPGADTAYRRRRRSRSPRRPADTQAGVEARMSQSPEVLLEHFAAGPPPEDTGLLGSGPVADGPVGGAGCATDFFDLTAGQCSLPVSEQQVARLLDKLEMRHFRPPPRHAPAPHRFSAWLADGCVGRSLAPGESIVFTADGSYCPATGKAGWGVVVSFQGTSGSSPGQFVGCIFGHIAASDHTVPLSAYVAEVCALWWASVAALQMPTPGPIIFRADNIAALNGVQGCDAMPGAPVCAAARAFHFSVGAGTSRQVSYVHVHGHQGDPANEMADAIANLGAGGETLSSPCRLEMGFWLREDAAAARWLPHVMLSQAVPSQLSPLRQDVFTWNMRQPEARLSAAQIMRPFTRPLQGRARANPQSARAFVCRFVTYNALSLLDPGETAAGRSLLVMLLTVAIVRPRDSSGGQNQLGYAELLPVSTSIGDHQCDQQDSAGSDFHGLLKDCQSWVPATFAQHMEGRGGTLLQKLNNELQRGDYVAIPAGWHQWSVRSWVDPAVTSGHAAPDHFASVVECHFAWAGGSKKLPPARIDPAALLDTANHGRVEGILQAAPPVSWDTNVSDHASILAEYLYTSLAEAFPLKARRMRLSFLSAETSTLHAHAAALRHALRGRLEALRLARLRCAFLAWRSPAGCYASLFQGRWLRQLCHVIAALSDRISVVGKRLRRFCRADKRRHVDSLADQLGQARQGEVHIVLKRLLRPKKFRRRGPAPLPKLKTADGRMCTTQEQVVETWRKHFSDLEGGVRVSVQELVDFGIASQRQTGAMEVLQAAEVPDLVKLAATFRDVNPQKACGPDMIPPSLCRGFASQMSVLFYPVLLKTLAYISEPIGMKGGSLFRIPKPGAADTASCSSQRAILVQSVLEKVLHKSVRGLTVRELELKAPALLIGGRKGLSYTMGFFCARSFLEFTRRKQIPAAILFSDISAAYYSVVRELLTGGKLQDASLEELAASLSLSNEDLQFMQSVLAEEPVLNGAGSHDLLAALTRELHSGTWFLMQQDDQIVRTRRGTRPGSSLADVLYALLFIQVLRRRGNFSELGLRPMVPWSGIRDLAPFDGRVAGATSVEVQDLIYADDLATCIVAATAGALPQAIQDVASQSFDTLAGHGLRSNIGPKKTAALMSVVGAGSREVRRAVFTEGRGRVPVLRERGPGVWLDIVSQYRHLGSVIVHDGSLVAEIKAKLQAARTCFHEGKAQVFCAPCVALARRVKLFRAHVLSTLFAGAGAWPLLCKTSWRLLETGLYNMIRQLLRLKPDQDQRWTHHQMLAAVGLPTLEGFLALERLRFLAQLVRGGPDAAFALLQQSPRALGAFKEAEQWILQAVGATGAPGTFGEQWPAWEALFAQARYQRFVRDHWERLPSPVVEVPATTHACLECRVAFAGVSLLGDAVKHAGRFFRRIASTKGAFDSAESIFQTVISCHGCLLGFVDDALLALQPDLWCEHASNAP